MTEPGPAQPDVESVLGYLRGRGFTVPDRSTTSVLAGGVSNVVVGVAADPPRDDAPELVVKMPLKRLRVAEEWLAPVDRVLAERDALAVAARLTPDSVPGILDCDEQAYVLVLARAPASWRNWKELLLAGDASASVASSLGAILAAWHGGTRDPEAVTARLLSKDAFAALRLDPFYRTAAGRLPRHADWIMECAARLASAGMCLVHGDFSPKNVLTGPSGGLWVVDFEVAHWGDPAFDLAFMICHLVLKSINRPQAQARYDRCIAAFCRAYEGALPGSREPAWPAVIDQVGCLLAARVVGKSPAEYLSAEEQRQVLRLGTSLMTDRPRSLAEMLAMRSAARVA
jgi:hypothetical protein